MPAAEDTLCEYVTNAGHECQRAGHGNPPLCRAHERHRARIEQELDADPIGRILENPGVQKLFDHAAQVIDSMSARLMASFLNGGASQQGPRPIRPPRPTAPPPATDPRVVLGLSPKTKLTAEIIKQRRKDLARLYHPDHGGSEEAMRKVNEAADLLLKEVK